jgi:transcriptional regulator with XRE-family HTH domain
MYTGLMSDAFRDWLTSELDKRHWSQRELARQTRVSQGSISLVLGGARPSADACIKIAEAFGESYWKVLTLAGILPLTSTSDDPTLQELMEVAQSLPPEDREELLKFAKFRYQQRKDKK